MATIRFEGVNITASVIEISGVENPQMLLEGLGLAGASVLEPATQVAEESKPIEIVAPVEKVAATQVAEAVSRPSPSNLDASEFKSVRRLRDVVQVFHDAGVTDVPEIVRQCEALQPSVGLLKRVTDIAGRMPIAIEKWQEAQRTA